VPYGGVCVTNAGYVCSALFVFAAIRRVLRRWRDPPTLR
jgi:hypothetical protein